MIDGKEPKGSPKTTRWEGQGLSQSLGLVMGCMSPSFWAGGKGKEKEEKGLEMLGWGC